MIARKKKNLGALMNVAIAAFLVIALFYFTTKVKSEKKVVEEKPAGAQVAYSYNLVANAIFNGTSPNGVYGIKSDWSPASGNDATESIFIWKGDVCKSFSGGYGPGELIASNGTSNKSTWTNTAVGYTPGSKYCVQIWKDFYGGVVGSNPSVVTIPTFSASAITPSSPTDFYGIKVDWNPATSNSDGTDITYTVWNGETCKSYPSYGPGELVWSFGVQNQTTYSNKNSAYIPGNKYCVQIERDFYKALMYTKPQIVQIPQATCTVTLTPNPLSLKMRRSANLEARVNVQNGFVNKVDFTTSNSMVASLNPLLDSSSPYQTTVFGNKKGSATITAKVNLVRSASQYSCQATSTVTVGN